MSALRAENPAHAALLTNVEEAIGSKRFAANDSAGPPFVIDDQTQCSMGEIYAIHHPEVASSQMQRMARLNYARNDSPNGVNKVRNVVAERLKRT